LSTRESARCSLGIGLRAKCTHLHETYDYTVAYGLVTQLSASNLLMAILGAGRFFVVDLLLRRVTVALGIAATGQ